MADCVFSAHARHGTGEAKWLFLKQQPCCGKLQPREMCNGCLGRMVQTASRNGFRCSECGAANIPMEDLILSIERLNR